MTVAFGRNNKNKKISRFIALVGWRSIQLHPEAVWSVPVDNCPWKLKINWEVPDEIRLCELPVWNRLYGFNFFIIQFITEWFDSAFEGQSLLHLSTKWITTKVTKFWAIPGQDPESLLTCRQNWKTGKERDILFFSLELLVHSLNESRVQWPCSTFKSGTWALSIPVPMHLYIKTLQQSLRRSVPCMFYLKMSNIIRWIMLLLSALQAILGWDLNCFFKLKYYCIQPFHAIKCYFPSTHQIRIA